MRRLSRREKRLVFALCGVAALGAASFYTAPSQGPNPEEVVAYYVKAFGSAKQITIRPTTSGGEPVTLTREKAPKLFRELESAARYAGVTVQAMPQPPKYLVDLVEGDGAEVKDISIGFTVDCPKQPARGKLALVPRDMATQGMGPMPVMAMTIEDYLDELHDPKGAKERREKRHEQMRLQARARMGQRGGRMPTGGGRRGRGAAGTPHGAPGSPIAPPNAPTRSR